MQRDLGITTLFVTHDRHEALETADALALMHEGRIDAQGPPAALYTDPPTVRAARALGEVNALVGRRDGGVFTCPTGRVTVASAADGPGTLLVRLEAVLLRPGGLGPGGLGPGGSPAATVRSVRFRGDHTRVTLALVGGEELVASAPPGLVEGDVVSVSVAEHAGRVLPGEDGGRAG